MGFVILGQGGLDVPAKVVAEGMEFVAIPLGTTLRVLIDEGAGVTYGPAQPDLMTQLHPPWPPLDATTVTYNLCLHTAPELWDEDLRHVGALDGHELVRAGVAGTPEPLRLCTGRPDLCPTDPGQVASGDRHRCDGVLATYVGDLYWLACSSFDFDDRSNMVNLLAESE